MTSAVNVLALVKESERYVFLFDEESYEELLRQLGDFASDSELNFSWYDAAVLSQRVRKIQAGELAPEDFGAPIEQPEEFAQLQFDGNRIADFDW